MEKEEMSSIYDSLVICHPKEHCSTWDFCSHYVPHVKGAACSCDSCEPCDFETVVAHRKRMGEKMVAEAVAANDAKWMSIIEGQKYNCDNSECSFGRCNFVSLFDKGCMWWQERKLEIELENKYKKIGEIQ